MQYLNMCVCSLIGCSYTVTELQQDWWLNYSDGLFCAGTHFSRHQHSHATSCRHFHLATPLPTEFPPTGLAAPQYQEVPPTFLPQALQQQYLIQQQLLQRRYTHQHSKALYKSYTCAEAHSAYTQNSSRQQVLHIFTVALGHEHKQKYILLSHYVR